jgi:hypothetical protein
VIDELEPFIAARNRALTAMDIEWARSMLPEASSDEVLVIAMHKSRYDCKAIDRKLRLESGDWLRARGYTAFGGRELLPPGELPE